MLVLTRKLDETIVINGDIRVTVLAIHPNQVRSASRPLARWESYVKSCMTGSVSAPYAPHRPRPARRVGPSRVDRSHRISDRRRSALGRSADEKKPHTLEHFSRCGASC